MCRVVVETPVNLGKRQKELLRELQQSLEVEGSQQSPRKGSWFEGMKSFFGDPS
jgi:molecular chaperone DnaJ